VTYYPILTVAVKGAFVPSPYGNLTEDRLFVDVEKRDRDGNMVPVRRNNGNKSLKLEFILPELLSVLGLGNLGNPNF